MLVLSTYWTMDQFDAAADTGIIAGDPCVVREVSSSIDLSRCDRDALSLRVASGGGVSQRVTVDGLERGNGCPRS